MKRIFVIPIMQIASNSSCARKLQITFSMCPRSQYWSSVHSKGMLSYFHLLLLLLHHPKQNANCRLEDLAVDFWPQPC